MTTDADSRVSISVNDGRKTWNRDFYDFGKAHSIPLLGFKPGRTNLLTITVYDKSRNQATAGLPLSFVTGALPADFPNIRLLQSQPEKMEPGYRLFFTSFRGTGYYVIVDGSGEIVWYSRPGGSAPEVRQLEDGRLFIFSTTKFMEMDMLGNIVKTWLVPTNLPIDIHEELLTDHGTIVYLSGASEVVSNYPTSTTDPGAPLGTATNLTYQRVVEISVTNSALLNVWPVIDQLDPRRLTYLTVPGPTVWDAQHANSVSEDPKDKGLIVSLRNQNAVIKISRATGQLVWILGPPENWGPSWQKYLLKPKEAPFAWQYGQHAAVFTPQGTLMIYDDGNFRATPFDLPVADTNNFSRAVEYQINENTMEISQVWEYGSAILEPLYTDKVGNAELLPETGNVLINFGSVVYQNGVPPSVTNQNAYITRIKEVTHDAIPQVVFDLRISQYDNTNVNAAMLVYRAHAIRDLNAHPALPVADLKLIPYNNSVLLQFSGDPARSYVIQASSDLRNWHWVDYALPDVDPGTFFFPGASFNQFKARYYRVLTL